LIARAASDPDPDATTERSVPLEIAEAAFATRTEPGLGAGSGTSTTWAFPPRKTTCFTGLRLSGGEGVTALDSCRVNDQQAFAGAYRQAVREIVPFLTPERVQVVARHNPGWGSFDFTAYLEHSEVRYQAALDLYARHAGQALPSRFLDIGGFLGAFPLALCRLGVHVVLTERYDYYGGAFDELRDLLSGEGVEIWDFDFTEPLDEPLPAERFDLAAAMAILEHLANSPRPLLRNALALLDEGGRLVADVPNIAYWPVRVQLLLGGSPLPPIRDIYGAEPPFTGHHHEYTAAELAAVLDWSGFLVDEVVTLNYSPWSDRRLLRRLALEWPRRFASMREVVLACARRP
jgi:SAM-dependent methyltransferase